MKELIADAYVYPMLYYLFLTLRALREEEDEEADAEDGSEHEGDGIRAAERA